MDTAKLAAAPKGVIGRTVTDVFLVESGRIDQIFFVFSDGSHYELYAPGGMSGARDLDLGDAGDVRQFLARSPDCRVTEVRVAPDV